MKQAAASARVPTETRQPLMGRPIRPGSGSAYVTSTAAWTEASDRSHSASASSDASADSSEGMTVNSTLSPAR